MDVSDEPADLVLVLARDQYAEHVRNAPSMAERESRVHSLRSVHVQEDHNFPKSCKLSGEQKRAA